jgi:hypothetical protein
MARVVRLNKAALFKTLGYEPHPGQLAIHNSRAPRRIVACGVRFGKSLCAAMEALAAAMEPRERALGWICAPTYDLSERVFNQAVTIAVSHLKHRIVRVSEHDRRLVLRNLGGGLSEIRGKSADNPISLLGEGLDFLIVDEASRLRPNVWEGHLSQRLIDRHGWALLISTPRGRGWFYDMWKRGKGEDPAFESWNLPSWSNPLLAREEIEAQREQLPDRVFRQELGAEFIEGAGAVFRYVRERATGEWQAARSGDTYSAGLDLAKVEDFTVLTIMNQRREVVHVDRFTRLDWSIQIGRIKAALDRYPCCYVLVDSTGAGEPIYEQLLRSGIYAKPYTFTAASKSDLVNHLALALEQAKITLPRADLAPELIDELESFEYSITDAGSVRMSAPSGVHDDCVMSLALALWQVGKGGAGTVSVLNLYSPGSRWTPLSRRLTYARRMALGGFRSG